MKGDFQRSTDRNLKALIVTLFDLWASLFGLAFQSLQSQTEEPQREGGKPLVFHRSRKINVPVASSSKEKQKRTSTNKKKNKFVR